MNFQPIAVPVTTMDTTEVEEVTMEEGGTAEAGVEDTGVVEDATGADLERMRRDQRVIRNTRKIRRKHQSMKEGNLEIQDTGN